MLRNFVVKISSSASKKPTVFAGSLENITRNGAPASLFAQAFVPVRKHSKVPVASQHHHEHERKFSEDPHFASIQQAQDRLERGNEMFQHDGSYLRQRLQVLAGQHPFAIVVTCSDSRVPPEVVFESGELGSLFVIRTAGHVISETELESIKYALGNLKPAPEVIVVLGHEKCGAVGAAYDCWEGHNKKVHNEFPLITEYLHRSINDVHKEAESEGIQLTRDEAVHRATRHNVLHTANLLVQKLKIEPERVLRAVYDLETGRVNWKTGDLNPAIKERLAEFRRKHVHNQHGHAHHGHAHAAAAATAAAAAAAAPQQ